MFIDILLLELYVTASLPNQELEEEEEQSLKLALGQPWVYEVLATSFS